MVHVSSILTLSLKIEIMKITNKITGRNVTSEYLALMQGIITNKEFELITSVSIECDITSNFI